MLQPISRRIMNKPITQRGLSQKFMSALKDEGILSPFLHRVHSDQALDLEIRNDYVNIYYRGGNIFRVAPGCDGQYLVSFNKEYAAGSRTSLVLPKNPITCIADAEKWITYIPQLKDTMDLWFGKHPKDERALQQLVSWENNTSPWANGTDYFIIDIEYDNHKGARFDLVALKWDSTPSARKLAKGYTPRLVIIEMKAGDGAVKGDAGILAHVEKTNKFLNCAEQVGSFKKEMLRIFSQKRELGLVKPLRKNSNAVTTFDANIEFMILFVGHDPSKTNFLKELNTINDTNCNVQVCAANFMGFGLFSERVYPLNEFKMKFLN